MALLLAETLVMLILVVGTLWVFFQREKAILSVLSGFLLILFSFIVVGLNMASYFFIIVGVIGLTYGGSKL